MFYKLIVAAAVLNGSVVQVDGDGPGMIGIRDNALTRVINKVYIGSPSYWSGVKPNDRLLSLKPNTGEPGDTCILKVKRGKEILTFKMVRQARESFYGGFSLTKDGVRAD